MGINFTLVPRLKLYKLFIFLEYLLTFHLQHSCHCLSLFFASLFNTIYFLCNTGYCIWFYTLNSTYNDVTFNEKSPIMKENLCTKYTPFTYKYIALNEKPPITKQNLCIFFFIIGRVECNCYI